MVTVRRSLCVLFALALAAPVPLPWSAPAAAIQRAAPSAQSPVLDRQPFGPTEGPVRVVRNSAEVEFQQGVLFRLEIEDDRAAPAETDWRATLVYQTGQSGVQVRASAAEAPAAGGRTLFEYRWPTVLGAFPPGMEISYRWDLWGADGRRWTSAPQTVTYVDTRFNWRKLQRDSSSVSWYAGDESFGRRLMDALQEARIWFERELDVHVESPIHLLAYESLADLQSAVGKGTAKWVGGGAFSHFGVVLVWASPRSSDERLRREVRHEVSHLALRALTGATYDVPLWLDEGVAMLAEGEPEERFADLLASAAREGKLNSLRALASAFPPDHDTAHLSYAQSQSVVRFIVAHYGGQKLRELLSVYREGASDDEALQRSVGLTVEQLDAAWRAELRSSPRPSLPEAASWLRAPHLPGRLAAVGGLVLGVLGLTALVLTLVLGGARRPRSSND